MARIAFTAGLAVAGNTAVHAAVWNQSAQASLRAGYDENPRMQIGDVRSTEYGAIDLEAHTAYGDESLIWTIDPRLVLVRYRDQDEINRTELYGVTALKKKFETGEYSLTYNWTRDTTLTSERGSTGLTGVNKPHIVNALIFSGQQSFTERLNSQGTLSTSAHRYTDGRKFGLVDYDYSAAQIDIGFAPSVQSRVSLNASIGRLNIPDQSLFNKTSQSLMLAYSLSFAQRWQTRISVGPSLVKVHSSTESGIVYAVELTRKAEASSLQLKILRDITPTGQGVLARRQQVTLTANHAFSERWNASVSTSMVKNDSLLVAADLRSLSLKYSDENIAISWRWTPTVTVSCSGGYSDQRLQYANRSAHRTYASINLMWNGLTHAFH